jgi:thiamine biosynthesis lipoprotein
MSIRSKNVIYSLLLFAALTIVYFIRKGEDKEDNEDKPVPVSFQGRTMGPIIYNVTYFDQENRNFKPQVDSLLEVFNQSLSTYIPDSEVSQFNRDSVFNFELPYFYHSLKRTKEISRITGGAFNPTIMPLVNLWGFGPEEVIRPDSSMVDSLTNLVNYDLVQYDSVKVWKLNKAVSVDYSASAKGQAVDVVAEYLETKGIENYFIEIGGEVRTGGINLGRERGWVVGILHPDSDEINQYFYATAVLKDKAMATSGNYFNYRIVDGLRYSHTISPFTGYPVLQPLLSASVVAEDCLSADALATAFMVMGHEEAIDFLNTYSAYDALLIYTSEEGEIKHYVTDGLRVNFK